MNIKTLNISLPEKLIADADEKAKSIYKSRSEYIKDLIIKDLEQKELPL